jgi:hypothetical protein
MPGLGFPLTYPNCVGAPSSPAEAGEDEFEHLGRVTMRF